MAEVSQSPSPKAWHVDDGGARVRLDGRHERSRRADTTPALECIERVGLALHHHLDGSVVEVARPAVHAEVVGLLPAGVAEEDALDPPAHDESALDHHCVETIDVMDVLTAAVLLLVAVRVGGVTRRFFTTNEVRQRSLAIVRGIRLRHVLPVPLVLAVVVTVASLLILVPGLSWGWWSAIGGNGNPVTGSTERTTGTVLEWLVPLAFLLLLLPALPLFAEAEEQRFRVGAEHWSFRRRVWRGVVFGLVHALIGIPIGVALALSIGGWYFTWWYVRGGVAESTRAHTAYNLSIVLVVLVAIATGGLT
jgi:hypothetical protein